MIDAYYIPVKEIEKIKWEDDANAYDLALYKLGCDHESFIVVNPAFSNFNFNNEATLPLVNSDRCVVWKYKDQWIAKYFTQQWIDEKKYWEVDLDLIWERNPDIDNTIVFDQPAIEDLYDLNYIMTWYIDSEFSTEKTWILKCQLQNNKPLGTKDMGYISPNAHIRVIYNPDIPNIEYSTKFNIAWHDFKYECVWYLDSKYNPNKDKVWAVKVKLRGGGKKPLKDMGYVSPKIIYNPALPNLEFTIDAHIPYYDLKYEHVWMLDYDLHYEGDNIWAAKITPVDPIGTKIVGNIKIDLPKQLDVVFISYNEPNAEENWRRVLEKSPKAFRVNGIKGIANAHKCAAELVTTDMFYVVDGDAYLDDDWNFDYQPKIFDRDCVHVWRSRNPVNKLEYGYGGVKLLPRELTLNMDITNTDMTTSISDKFKVMPAISNTTAFNTDEFNAWRSGFRECAKLSGKILKRQLARESEKRLNVWCTAGHDQPFGKWAIKGAIAGREFGKENAKDHVKLSLINNFDWLKLKFDQEYSLNR